MKALIRILIVTGLLGGAGVVGYWKLTDQDLRRTLREMETLQQEMTQRLEAKEAMLQRLNRNERLAHIQITNQTLGPDGRVVTTELVLIELDDEGGELARQPFTIPGDVLFVDALSVKFHHDDIAAGHPLRGQTLLLLHRIYSDQMPPIDGYPIDTPGAIPPAYATGEIARFEQRMWEHFWEMATNPEVAEAMGVRVAQGEAVYKPVKAGRTYELVVDAAGGMSLKPLPQPSS